MSTIALLYFLLLTVTVIYGIGIWHLAGWITELRKANHAMDNDLNDLEEEISDHRQLLNDLEEMRTKLESTPARIAALESKNRLLIEEEEDDVLYASRR